MEHDFDRTPTFRRSVKAFGTEDFETVLTRQLEKHPEVFNLAYHGDLDGEPGEPSITIMSKQDSGKTISVKVMVGWAEYRSPGCRDVTLTSQHTAMFQMSIKKKGGEATFTELDHQSNWGR